MVLRISASGTAAPISATPLRKFEADDMIERLRDIAKRFACRQTMLCEEVGDGTIRRAFAAQLRDDILCREQVLEFLRTARREFFDCLADCGWIK